MKKAIIFAFKIVLLAIIMIIGMSVSSLIVGIHQSSQSSSSPFALILIYSFLNTLILSVFIINSKDRGFKLILKTFIIFYGTQYFMTQIETIYFNYAVKMPLSELTKVLISGGITAIIFSLAAVLILGKYKGKKDSIDLKFIAYTYVSKLIPSILLLSFIYVLIYFIFGYFVAWQFADLRQFYSGSTNILNVFQHCAKQFRDDPMLPLFQFIRGILWCGLSIVIINSLKNKGIRTYVITALLFSILITSPLLFPNAYMPASVRLGHSLELATSMLTYGIISVGILRNKIRE